MIVSQSKTRAHAHMCARGRWHALKLLISSDQFQLLPNIEGINALAVIVKFYHRDS